MKKVFKKSSVQIFKICILLLMFQNVYANTDNQKVMINNYSKRLLESVSQNRIFGDQFVRGKDLNRNFMSIDLQQNNSSRPKLKFRETVYFYQIIVFYAQQNLDSYFPVLSID